MSKIIELYWTLRSPYCYLAADRCLQMAEKFDILFDFRIVYPQVLVDPSIIEKRPKEWLKYVVIDSLRTAKYLNKPIILPYPDIVAQDYKTYQLSPHQPYIHRLTRLAQLATEKGWGLEFATQFSTLLCTVKNWHEGDHIARIADNCDLNLEDMDREIIERADELEMSIAKNQAALEKAGHWGVPCFVLDGEPFFGQDRIHLVEWRLEQAGLRRNKKGQANASR